MYALFGVVKRWSNLGVGVLIMDTTFLVINKYGTRESFDNYADARYALHNALLESYLYKVKADGRLEKLGGTK